MSTTSRGYGHNHQQMRAQYAARMEQGETFVCAKCKRLVVHGMAWHLGHTDDRRGYTGPEHEECNLLDAGRRGAAARHERCAPAQFSREW